MSNSQNNIPESIVQIVRYKARKMVGQAGLNISDVEDIEQSLYVKVLQNIDKHDPTRAPIDAFVRTFLNRHAANIVRDRKAAKRDPRRCVSLHVTVYIEEGEAAELSAQIGQRELDARTGVFHRAQLEQVELESDLAELVSKLNDQDRELVRALKWEKISQIARRTGIPRTTLHGRVRKLRQQFEEAGLKEYLK